MHKLVPLDDGVAKKKNTSMLASPPPLGGDTASPTRMDAFRPHAHGTNCLGLTSKAHGYSLLVEGGPCATLTVNGSERQYRAATEGKNWSGVLGRWGKPVIYMEDTEDVAWQPARGSNCITGGNCLATSPRQ